MQKIKIIFFLTALLTTEIPVIATRNDGAVSRTIIIRAPIDQKPMLTVKSFYIIVGIDGKVDIKLISKKATHENNF